MRLILIRHGESEHSARGIIAGPRECPGLTSNGVEQAKQLARRLQSTQELADCSAFLSSPVKRAVQTAELLRAAFPGTDLIEERRLIEIDPGEADGLHHDEYHKRYGSFDLIAEPERLFAPGGESWSQFRLRIRQFQMDLVSRYEGQTVVAVAHAGTIVATLLQTFDIPRPGTGARFEPGHTSLTEWRYDGVWILERYNDTLHLQLQDVLN